MSTITVLAGGVGAARFLAGLVTAVDPARVTAVVNTGDDLRLHGLHIAPDLDTVTYTLASAIDPERGWGLAGETWQAMGALERYAAVRPAGSSAATTWFNLGDRDLATHCYRTARLAEDATLTTVTAEITAAWGLTLRVLPMSNDPAPTTVVTADHGSMGFQEYFVQHRHSIAVTAVHVGADTATITPEVRQALTDAGTVIIAPSNPLVSIGPIRALGDVDELLAHRRDQVVAISPIVGGRALKGPADRMMVELGHDPTVTGVARLYRHVAGTLVIDHADAHLAAEVEQTGMRCVVTSTVMTDRRVAADLATVVLAHSA